MSEIKDILVHLIMELDDKNIVPMEELIDALGVADVKIAYIKHKKNLNYKEISKYLNVVDFVFLQLGYKEMSYAKKRLEELTNKEIVKTKSRYGDKHGYLVSVKKD